MMARLTLAMLLLTSLVSATAGEPIRLVSHPGGGPGIGVAGVVVTCPTSAGGMVWWVVSQPGGGPVGRNSSRGGVSWTPGPEPHIFIRADIFGALPPQVQLYIALHECAHFLLPSAQNTELNADCWAVRTALENRWLGEADIEFVRKKLEASGNVSDWGHPGALIHAENLPKCLAR